MAEDPAACERFLAEVDASSVYANASTRFTDGGEFGLGAEIGISTQKLHARGPFAAEALTTYKYVVRGTGPGPPVGPRRPATRHSDVPSVVRGRGRLLRVGEEAPWISTRVGWACPRRPTRARPPA